jgi:hypothetical protein
MKILIEEGFHSNCKRFGEARARWIMRSDLLTSTVAALRSACGKQFAKACKIAGLGYLLKHFFG